MERHLVDTGFLVALGRARDPLHAAARSYLEQCTVPLVTVSAVIVEACHFLSLESRRALLEWVAADGPTVIEVPQEAYPELSSTMSRYKERDVDFADAALLWLAEQTGHRIILTVDEADFQRFRLSGGARFELVEWQSGQAAAATRDIRELKGRVGKRTKRISLGDMKRAVSRRKSGR